MLFTGSAGTVRSEPEGMVAGYGTTSVHSTRAFTASMTPTATMVSAHTYIFTVVSIITYRVMSRAKAYISVFRTK